MNLEFGDERLPVSFWARVEIAPSGCWVWAGAHNRGGYALWKRAQDASILAHRNVYVALMGAIPDGLVIDHLCRVHGCVNPIHMEPVSSRVNTLRGETVAARHAAKTHCPRGHEYNSENTYLYQRRRSCRVCTSESKRAYKRRVRSA